jgi:transposase-like protein
VTCLARTIRCPKALDDRAAARLLRAAQNDRIGRALRLQGDLADPAGTVTPARGAWWLGRLRLRRRRDDRQRRRHDQQVGAGLQVMGELMQADVAALCGPRGKHDPQRTATRHGSGRGSVTLGGRRVPVTRPRVRAADGSGELPVPAYELFTGTEVLGRMAMERMLAGLSARRYGVGLEPVGEQVSEAATATSKSAVSRRFVAMTEHALTDLLAADLSQLDLVALMVDGVRFAEHLCVVALGIDIDGVKHPLALAEGSTENTTLVRGLLVGLRERGLDTTKPILAVLDGAKALRSAVLEVFDHPVLARCQLHYAEHRIMPSRSREGLWDTGFVLMRSA